MNETEQLKEARRLLEAVIAATKRTWAGVHNEQIAAVFEDAQHFLSRTAPRHWPEIPQGQDMVFVGLGTGNLYVRPSKAEDVVIMCNKSGTKRSWAKPGSAVAAQLCAEERSKHVGDTGAENDNSWYHWDNVADEWLRWGGWK